MKCILVIESITLIQSYGPFVHETTTSIHIAHDFIAYNIDKATKSYHYSDSKLNFTNKNSASLPFMINNRATKSDRRSVLQIIANHTPINSVLYIRTLIYK